MANEKHCPHCHKPIDNETISAWAADLIDNGMISAWVADVIIHSDKLAERVKSNFARSASRMRKEFRGSERLKKVCEFCGKTIESARAYRLHKPRCPQNPGATKRGEPMPPIPKK